MPPSRRKAFQAEKFGFDKAQRHRALHQLRDLLELDDRQFIELRKKFGIIVRSRLDINKIGRSQQQAMDMAIEDLRSQLPALFMKGNIEQRAYFASRALLIMHSCRRKLDPLRKFERISKTRANARLSEKTPNTRANASLSAKTPNTRANASLSEKTPNTRANANLSERTPNTRANASLSEPTAPNDQVPPLSLVRRYSSHIDGSKAIHVEKNPFSTPTSLVASSSTSTLVASSSTSTSCEDMQGCSVAIPPSRGGQIRSVHKFLEAAIPSMTHLLHRFIEFGCLGEDFLFAVSTWSPERIRTFLKSLPPGPGGSTLTRMEVDILAYHFESYFLASNSKA
ncbi:hypothetical protein BYT27DRAFT_7180875 [Phlegmacium glaucopus]|nr:hypothetical protein BYT27DRAFT_7180875 [Phlegmacium glaucopus]